MRTNDPVVSIMRPKLHVFILRALLPVAALGALGGRAPAWERDFAAQVTLTAPFEVVSPDSAPPALTYKLESLAQIDPARPLGEPMAS
jgi:hypothetical protein